LRHCIANARWGIVFVELISMADSAIGEGAVDAAIARCPLASKGAHTTVGNYDHSELGMLLEEFSQASGTPADTLQRQFGQWMNSHFLATFPTHYDARKDAFSMLESIEKEVHVEVRKLYPEAELPVLQTERLAEDVLLFTYQ
jgi:hypothetical protein